MSGPRLIVDLSQIYALAVRIGSQELVEEIQNVLGEKDIEAIISQAIAENFDREGPGWEPLKIKTIRTGMSKPNQKIFRRLNNKDLMRRDALIRKGTLDDAEENELGELTSKLKLKGAEQEAASREVSRRILQRSGFLKKSVTTVGAQGNIYKVEPDKLTWGTDLAYARIHNQGGWIKTKGKGYGPHAFRMPKREFLRLDDEAWARLGAAVLELAQKAVDRKVSKRGK